VQRDAPDANRGRSFARFETRFQLTWVAGAFLPVIISIPLEIGFLVIAGCAGFALFSYLAGLRGLDRGEMPVRRNPTEAITTRLRRRRQGFAPDTEPSPSDTASDPAGGPPAIESAVAAGPSGAVDGRPPIPPPPPPPLGPAEARADDDAEEARPPPPGDRRVVIDPTNLQ
jgi:hypothetical protein